MITGGKSGLGGVLSEILTMRGVGVAVLDVAITEEEEEEGNGEERGTRVYKCDVADTQSLEKVWGRVVDEVCITPHISLSLVSSHSIHQKPSQPY